MDVLQAIRTRRSIREYTEEPVSGEAIRTLLEAGFCAPTARNLRPWNFLVLRDPALREKIPAFHPYAAMTTRPGAAVIVICADLKKQPSREYAAQDCAAAAQNMLLAAHGLGLGAVWLGMYPNEERCRGAHEAFGIPEDMLPAAMVCVGHPAQQREAPQRYDDACVHEEQW
ncbi:MAG: nitroreductase family protein [Eubacteriales bacterium]|nr:nitroreductase family protein [Eubacteriales bacterium]